MEEKTRALECSEILTGKSMRSILPPVGQLLPSRWGGTPQTPSAAPEEQHSGRQRHADVVRGSSQRWINSIEQRPAAEENSCSDKLIIGTKKTTRKSSRFPPKMPGCPLFLSVGNEGEASWLETSTISKQGIVWFEQTTCSFPRANLSSQAVMNILPPQHVVIFFCCIFGCRAGYWLRWNRIFCTV